MARIKSRLNNEFPEGEFTAFLNDPDFFVKRAEKNSRIEMLYEEAYKDYLLNDFVTPISNLNQAVQIDDNNELLPKFKLVAGFRITSYNVCYTKLLRSHFLFETC